MREKHKCSSIGKKIRTHTHSLTYTLTWNAHTHLTQNHLMTTIPAYLSEEGHHYHPIHRIILCIVAFFVTRYSLRVVGQTERRDDESRGRNNNSGSRVFPS